MQDTPSPDADQPKDTDAPRETAAAPVAGAPRAKLSIKKQEAVVDTETTGLASTHRAVRPVKEGPKNLGLLVAIIITAALGAGGWYGFKHLENQKQRIRDAETARNEALRQRDSLRSAEAELRAKVARIPDETRNAINQAELKITAQLRAAAEADFAALRDKLAEAQTKAAQLRMEAQRQEEAARIELQQMQKSVEALEKKVTDIAKENEEMKAWLRTHNLSMHPRYY